ncbi:aldose 1-epimerase [Paenibacillus sp.]|uniref:aldose 1-epimerase n=1 Tax=Paenibacillus sp. TaxID=58172 RepID=UPI002D38BA1D|nr:aldose 1-epimerase [Paenibacillus sp.]HZG58526.1 aldose 1-epimerase [Paenibacillus sp.]
MHPTIEHITFLGESAVRVTTEKLEGVVVPAWGSNLISLTWRPTGQPLLRTPATAEAYHARTTLHGMPILFPPSRIAGGTFRFRGREYRFPMPDPARPYHIHGVLMREPWRLSEAAVDGEEAYVETTIVAEETPAVYAALPHRFTVRQRFRFTTDAVELRFVLESRDEEAMPWGLGYHTTFLLPLPGGDLSRCTLQLRADKTWALDEQLLPSGELVDNPYRDAMAAGLPLDRVELDDVFLASPDAPFEAILTDAGAGLRIRYEGDRRYFTQWVLYNGKGKPDRGFFCPEPLTWVPNAPNVNAPAELTGLQALEPGASAEVVSKLTISEV